MFAAQVSAVVIFLVMFVLLITERLPRQTVTLTCGLATLIIVFGICLQDPNAITESLSFQSFLSPGFWYQVGEAETSTGINWETIVFIAGMMVMVEGMAASGFFRWLCIKLARAVHFRPAPLFFLFMALAGLLSMFIDSITVIMFLAAVTAELARLLDLNPVPFILSEIFCANLGGSATMCGDPPNIIIGTSLGYSFFNFITNTGLIALVSALIVVPYFYFYFRRELVPLSGKRADPASFPDPKAAITSKRSFLVSCVIFAAAVVLLVTHAQTGLTVSTIGLAIALVTLAAAGKNAPKLLRKIDYGTILFFIGLFIAVSGLEYTGVLELLAQLIERVSGGNAYIMIGIIIWGSAFASAFIDNIPFAATMIPVIRTLSAAQGVDLQCLAWALSMGTDIGGSATPIGASANVVGTSIAAKNGFPVAWGRYCRAQTLPTVLVLLVSTLIVFIRYL